MLPRMREASARSAWRHSLGGGVALLVALDRHHGGWDQWGCTDQPQCLVVPRVAGLSGVGVGMVNPTTLGPCASPHKHEHSSS